MRPNPSYALAGALAASAREAGVFASADEAVAAGAASSRRGHGGCPGPLGLAMPAHVVLKLREIE